MNLRGLRNKRATAADSASRGGGSAVEKSGMGQRIKEAGQIIAIFALMLTALIGLVGIAIDVTFAWREELRVQRAADAAALAGVVYLPGDVPDGLTASTDEATKNGFTTGDGTVVSPSQDASNPRQMNVTITTPVPTFFVRIFGVNSFTISRTAKAVFILPVPMGSPDQYYGVYGNYKMKNSSGSDVTVTMKSPTGSAVTGRGFWATMLTQGAGASSGDAYLPTKLNADQSGSNPMHDTDNYYDYDIVMPAGSTNGRVYIFDPVFCATDGRYGAGDYYLSSSHVTKVSSYFKLYNTNNQPYNLPAQTYLGSSGSLFANDEFADSLANAPSLSGTTSCSSTVSPTPPITDPRHWHNAWWELTGPQGASTTLSGGASGTIYRLRTTTDPDTEAGANAYNDFSIYVTASGGTPQVYGQGAMEMYTPLPSGGASTFYLAQIDAQSGAGKTIEVQLWDVGDTNGLSANLQILQPTSSGWSAVSGMTWTANKVSSDSSSCPSGSGSSITTYRDGKLYNGCWLIIDIVVPSTYTAPQSGWWKIQYNMGSGATDMSTDLTTWQVNIRGNPVHLIPG